MASRAERFDDLVLDAAGRVEDRWGKPFPAVEFAVEDVPPSDPAPWEHAEVPLGRLFPGTAQEAARVVVYRRPVETRVQGQRELASLVAEVVTEQLAGLLGVRPEELDPELGDE